MMHTLVLLSIKRCLYENMEFEIFLFVEIYMSVTAKEFLAQRSKEIHKRVVRKFKRAKIKIRGPRDTYALDLVDMVEVIKENAYRYMLVVIDGYSRKAWSVPLKTKTAKEVWAAFDKIGKKIGFPKTVWLDKGGEYYNAI